MDESELKRLVHRRELTGPHATLCDELPGLRESQIVATVLETGDERADRIRHLLDGSFWGRSEPSEPQVQLSAGLEAFVPFGRGEADDLGEDGYSLVALSEAIQVRPEFPEDLRIVVIPLVEQRRSPAA